MSISPGGGLCAPRSQLSGLPEQSRQSKQSPGTKHALEPPALLATPPAWLRPTPTFSWHISDAAKPKLSAKGEMTSVQAQQKKLQTAAMEYWGCAANPQWPVLDPPRAGACNWGRRWRPCSQQLSSAGSRRGRQRRGWGVGWGGRVYTNQVSKAAKGSSSLNKDWTP